MRSPFELRDGNRDGRAGRGHAGGARREGGLTLRWIVSVAAVVAGLAVAFLYLHLISVLSSVTAVASTLAPTQDAPATSLAASPPNAPASGPSNQVAQPRTGSTPTTSTEAESRQKQVKEILDVARAELANAGRDALEIQQVEAQVKAAMEAIEAYPSPIDQYTRVATERDDERGDGRTRQRRKRH